jgi:protein-disulfide isomerase
MNTRKIMMAGAGLTALIAVALVGVTALDRGNSPLAGMPTPDTAAVQDQADSQATLASVQEIGADEHVLGDADAPITIIEYSSLTCPHCASFHQDTLPQLKQEWIETGKAKLVFRHYPLDRLALGAALMTNCFEGDRFFAVLEMLFAQQQQWARADNPGQALARIGAQAGMDRSTFEQCVTDQQEAQDILAKQEAGRKQAEIQSTPTFLIEGEKIEGAKPYAEFDKVLSDLEEGA